MSVFKRITIWVCCLGVLISVSCFENNSRPSLKKADYKFAFITCAVNATFFKPVIKGMTDAAEIMGVHCDFMGN